MEKLNIKEVVRLNHKLFQKRLSFKINITDEYTGELLPVGREEGTNEEKEKIFDTVREFYDALGCDVIFDTMLMSFHVYGRRNA